MALKTFNIDSDVYKTFSNYCKKEGLSMSRKIENFIREEMGKLGAKAKEEKAGKIERNLKKECDVEVHPLSKYC